MNRRMIANILGKVLEIFAVLMLLPLLVACICREDGSAIAFAVSGGLTGLAGYVLRHIPTRTKEIFAREGFASVGLAWIAMGIFGALPFVLNGDIPDWFDALFESVSAITTTGASIVSNTEAMSRSGLFWRMFMHWIGGMGVLVFLLAVMPNGEEHTMHIMRAEVAGPTVGKLVPKASQTAQILYVIYAGLTVLETIMLMLGGMSFYDALLHACATACTGGFSTRTASIAAFDSAYIETVISIFLVIFGINFNLYYFILIGHVKEALKSEELHLYFGIIIASTVAIAAGIVKMYGGIASALHIAFFNTMAVITTAGFITVDFTTWPHYTQFILVLLMFMGGCAGSTAGGMKVSRVLLLMKTAAADIAKVLHPREARCVRMDSRRVSDATTKAVYSYFFIYLSVILFAGCIVSMDGFDFTTSFTAALACMSNVGPGLAMIGPMSSYAIFSKFTRFVLMIVMLLGRLEVYPIVILASPALWKRK